MKAKSIFIIFMACFISISSATENIETDQEVWVFADIHGAYDEFVKLLLAANFIDKNLNWSGGKKHLISTGDVVDQGPYSRKVLDLMIKIDGQSKQAGGAFHFILGNHEVMALTGDLRDVSNTEYLEFSTDENEEMRERYFKQYLQYQSLPAATNKTDVANPPQPDLTQQTKIPLTEEQHRQNFEKQHQPGFFSRYEAFLPQGKYGSWLLKKQMIQKVNGDIYTHGGLSPLLNQTSFVVLQNDLKQTLVNYVKDWNELISDNHLPVASPFENRARLLRGLSNDKIALFREHYKQLLFTRSSPTEYQGDALCHSYYENAVLTELLQKLRANRLFVGHTPTSSHQVEVRLAGRVYLMDTGMLNSVFGGHGNILKVESNNVSVLDTKGNSYSAIQGIQHPSFYPKKLNLDELEKIINTGSINEIESLSTGITKPLRLTFNAERIRVRALFKDIDTLPGWEKNWRKHSSLKLGDRYLYEIAAFRLSEMLGFNMVPLSTFREVNSRSGAAQFWVEDSYSEYTAGIESRKYEGHCSYYEQKNMMRIFDLLIYNKDRNRTNVLIEKKYNQLIWIDHSRSFSTRKYLPKNIKVNRIKITDEMRLALESLNLEDLNHNMKGLLNIKQIEALLKRRNLILKLVQN